MSFSRAIDRLETRRFRSTRQCASNLISLAAAIVLAAGVGGTLREAGASEEQKTEIPTLIDIDEATKDLFQANSYLLETATPNKPKRCDDLKDRVYWVNIKERIRSDLRQQDISVADFVAGFLTLGLSAFYGKEPPSWTIFSAKTDGRYVTFLLGQPRGDDEDKVGPQTRLTYCKLDAHGKRLGLVEMVPVDAPPFAKPQKGPPKYKTVHLRCVYRSDESNIP
jgi:hypothetical protein